MGVSVVVLGSFVVLLIILLDVVKMRIMFNVGSLLVLEIIWEIMSRIVWKEGVCGIFWGVMFCGIWMVLGSGLYLGLYEMVKIWFKGILLDYFNFFWSFKVNCGRIVSGFFYIVRWLIVYMVNVRNYVL